MMVVEHITIIIGAGVSPYACPSWSDGPMFRVQLFGFVFGARGLQWKTDDILIRV